MPDIANSPEICFKFERFVPELFGGKSFDIEAILGRHFFSSFRHALHPSRRYRAIVMAYLLRPRMASGDSTLFDV